MNQDKTMFSFFDVCGNSVIYHQIGNVTTEGGRFIPIETINCPKYQKFTFTNPMLCGIGFKIGKMDVKFYDLFLVSEWLK